MDNCVLRQGLIESLKMTKTAGNQRLPLVQPVGMGFMLTGLLASFDQLRLARFGIGSHQNNVEGLSFL